MDAVEIGEEVFKVILTAGSPVWLVLGEMTEHGEMRAMAPVDSFVPTLPKLGQGHALNGLDKAVSQVLLEE